MAKIKTKKLINFLSDADPEFVSFVHRGANRTGFKVVKTEEDIHFVQKPPGGGKPSGNTGTSQIQSIIFDKDKWTKSEAVAWLKSENHKSSNYALEGNYHRFRQFDPKYCKADTYGTKDWGKGKKAIFCVTTSSKEDSDMLSMIEKIGKTIHDKVMRKSASEKLDPYYAASDFDEAVKDYNFYPQFQEGMMLIGSVVMNILEDENITNKKKAVGNAIDGFRKYVIDTMKDLSIKSEDETPEQLKERILQYLTQGGNDMDNITKEEFAELTKGFATKDELKTLTEGLDEVRKSIETVPEEIKKAMESFSAQSASDSDDSEDSDSEAMKLEETLKAIDSRFEKIDESLKCLEKFTDMEESIKKFSDRVDSLESKVPATKFDDNEDVAEKKKSDAVFKGTLFHTG